MQGRPFDAAQMPRTGCGCHALHDRILFVVSSNSLGQPLRFGARRVADFFLVNQAI
jgi:sugar lactone lactonase YvrE